jgi:hypothetical protein
MRRLLAYRRGDMSDIGDIDDGGSGDGAIAPAAAVAAAAGAAACLACGHKTAGFFCSSCGQKNDDLRRSSYVLAKDFFKDTFGFDSRMWRTLGLLAVAPGAVPKNYAHGRRSRFTPPVRLFLVVSFLFFLTVGLTNTLFVGLEVSFGDDPPAQSQAKPGDDPDVATEAAPDLNCSFHGDLRFFVKERDLKTDRERASACFGNVRDGAREAIAQSDDVSVGAKEGIEAEREQAGEVIDRVFTGINWAVANPRAFNDAFNDWLPRVLFFMTPVLALVLTLFLRRGALVFDHLVLSFYMHAAGFAVIGVSLILAQFGAPYMGAAAFMAIAVYYIAALKRTYGRGWIKTVWTGLASGALYLLVFLTILMTITSNIVWKAAA